MTMEQHDWQALLLTLRNLGLTIGKADRHTGEILVKVPPLPEQARRH